MRISYDAQNDWKFATTGGGAACAGVACPDSTACTAAGIVIDLELT